MGYDYATYVTELTTLMSTQPTNANFVNILPAIINYAEQRIYRELDLLATVVRDSSGTFTANNRNFTLPTTYGTFVTVQGVNVITPVSTAPDSGQRNELVPTTRDFLDKVWNSVSGATIPTKFAMIDNANIIVGPWPDNSYTVEVIGTIRPAPLSPTNTTTFLTTNLPDLFLAASMIFACGYQRNFGAQADTPQMAQSWESTYNFLFSSANNEQLRLKFAGPGWTSLSSVANPPNR